MRDKVSRQCPQTTTFWRERRAEADSNRSLSAYQPNALPLGQTGSRFMCKFGMNGYSVSKSKNQWVFLEKVQAFTKPSPMACRNISRNYVSKTEVTANIQDFRISSKQNRTTSTLVRARSCVKVEMAVLGSPSLIVLKATFEKEAHSS